MNNKHNEVLQFVTKVEPYRSKPLVNMEYDMVRITIDSPIREFRKWGGYHIDDLLHDFGDNDCCADCHDTGMWETTVGEFTFCTSCAYGVSCLKANYEDIKKDRDRLLKQNHDLVIRFGKQACRNCACEAFKRHSTS